MPHPSTSTRQRAHATGSAAARLLVVGLALLAPTAVARAQPREVGPSIERYLEPLIRERQLSGALLVARGDSVLFERAYGRRDFRKPTPNTPTTLFAAASITKALTGIVARTLIERGLLKLDDPIARWLPDFPMGDSITVGMLLSHRSGIPHRVTRLADEQRAQTAASMVVLAGRAPLAFPPGTRRLYSSTGYSVLARVLELASGRTYAQLLREIVLAPAGAQDAVDATERDPAPRARASGHFWTPAGPLPAADKELSFLVGAGSLWSTPRDLFKVARRVASGAYGTAAAGARGADGSVAWNGFSNGSFARVEYRPADDLTIVVMSNLLTGAEDWVLRDVPRIAAGEDVATPTVPAVRPVALSAPRRASLSGAYDYFGNRQELAFLSPSTALLGGEYMFVATSDSSLFAPQNYTRYAVESDSAGVRALTLRGPDGLSIPRVR